MLKLIVILDDHEVSGPSGEDYGEQDDASDYAGNGFLPSTRYNHK